MWTRLSRTGDTFLEEHQFNEHQNTWNQNNWTIQEHFQEVVQTHLDLMLWKFLPSERVLTERFLASHTSRVMRSMSRPEATETGHDQSQFTSSNVQRCPHRCQKCPNWKCWGSLRCSPPGSGILPNAAEDKQTRSNRRGQTDEDKQTRSNRRGQTDEDKQTRSNRRGQTDEDKQTRSNRRGQTDEDKQTRSNRRGQTDEDKQTRSHWSADL